MNLTPNMKSEVHKNASNIKPGMKLFYTDSAWTGQYNVVSVDGGVAILWEVNEGYEDYLDLESGQIGWKLAEKDRQDLVALGVYNI